MAERLVTHTCKDPRTGEITRLCNVSESWSPRAKADAIDDIENAPPRLPGSLEGHDHGNQGGPGAVRKIPADGSRQLNAKQSRRPA